MIQRRHHAACRLFVGLVTAALIAPISQAASFTTDLPLSTQNGSFSTNPNLRVKIEGRGEGKFRFSFRNTGGGSINDVFFEKGLFKDYFDLNSQAPQILASSEGVSFGSKEDLSRITRELARKQPYEANAIKWKGNPLSFHAKGNTRDKRIENGLQSGDRLNVMLYGKNDVKLRDLKKSLFEKPNRIAWAAEERVNTGISTGADFSVSLTIIDSNDYSIGVRFTDVPEPNTLSLLLAGGTCVMHRRRRRSVAC